MHIVLKAGIFPIVDNIQDTVFSSVSTELLKQPLLFEMLFVALLLLFLFVFIRKQGDSQQITHLFWRRAQDTPDDVITCTHTPDDVITCTWSVHLCWLRTNYQQVNTHTHMNTEHVIWFSEHWAKAGKYYTDLLIYIFIYIHIWWRMSAKVM